MLFTVYILYSDLLDQYYIGHTSDIDDRLYRHVNSGSKSTKKANDWRIVYIQLFQSKTETVKREFEIKRKKSRKYIEWLISSAGLERPADLREGHP
jgi:putative endonuclease